MSQHRGTSVALAVATCLLTVSVTACSPSRLGPRPAPPETAPASGSVASDSQKAATPAAKAAGLLEKSSLKLAVPGGGASGPQSLPVHFAVERTLRDEGLDVEMVGLSGAALSQALVSGSVDVLAGSIETVITMVEAGHAVKAFYVGVTGSFFEWFGAPGVNRWADLRGKNVGIPSYGSFTEYVTYHALRKHGLEPGRDVQILTVGTSPTALQALRAGKIDLAILGAPTKWQAEAEGFPKLGTEATEVARESPRSALVATEQFIQEHPHTIRALIRGLVKAMRLIKSEREVALQAIVEVYKYPPQDAERAYAETVVAFNERGALPTQSMPAFWDVAMAAGLVSEPWPEERFLDRRFIDSFDEWAPK